ncbi:hypothetical protein [Bizionia psychrotolerans]|uniref:hypothetical protein n=1 Tax=Bizionia psychrotolerans TaxID=1492901 RepID=UPI00065038E8|nr:hypothetical protein [Bizionia psychrotolerans]
MTPEQLQSKKYIIDYLSKDERKDPIINSAIENLKKIENSSYHLCKSPNDIGLIFDLIKEQGSDIIIHFLAHGGKYGISRKTDIYFVEVIHWELLLQSFKSIKERCNSLSINLMAVCSSYYITLYENKPYNSIWTTNKNTNSIENSIRIYSKKSYDAIVNSFEESGMFNETMGNE